MASSPKAPADPIDARLVRKLADILTETGLTEIEVEHNDLKIRVAKTAAPAAVQYAPAPAAYAAAPAPAAAGAGDVPSPLAGKVVSLDVAAGAPVKAGDQILTLEAMKMNTIIYAPASGTLTAFCVNPGDTVQEGQALAKIG